MCLYISMCMYTGSPQTRTYTHSLTHSQEHARSCQSGCASSRCSSMTGCPPAPAQHAPQRAHMGMQTASPTLRRRTPRPRQTPFSAGDPACGLGDSMQRAAPLAPGLDPLLRLHHDHHAQYVLRGRQGRCCRGRLDVWRLVFEGSLAWRGPLGGNSRIVPSRRTACWRTVTPMYTCTYLSLYTNTAVISLILSLALSIRAHGLHVSQTRIASALCADIH